MSAKVTAVTSSKAAINSVMSVAMVEKYVATALSRHVSKAVTEWQNNTFTLEKARAKGGEYVSSGVAKGGDIWSAGMAKGEEIMDNLRQKGHQ